MRLAAVRTQGRRAGERSRGVTKSSSARAVPENAAAAAAAALLPSDTQAPGGRAAPGLCGGGRRARQVCGGVPEGCALLPCPPPPALCDLRHDIVSEEGAIIIVMAFRRPRARWPMLCAVPLVAGVAQAAYLMMWPAPMPRLAYAASSTCTGARDGLRMGGRLTAQTRWAQATDTACRRQSNSRHSRHLCRPRDSNSWGGHAQLNAHQDSRLR